MTIEDNRALVQRYFEYWISRDFDAQLALTAEDCRFWIIGDFPGSGWRTREQIIKGMASGYYNNDDFPEDVSYTMGTMTAEENRVAVIVDGYGPMSNGKVYKPTYFFYFEVTNGKISMVKEYNDSVQIVDCMVRKTKRDLEYREALRERLAHY